MTLRKRSREMELVKLLSVGDEMHDAICGIACAYVARLEDEAYKDDDRVKHLLDELGWLKKLAANWAEATKHYSRSDGHKLGEKP